MKRIQILSCVIYLAVSGCTEAVQHPYLLLERVPPSFLADYPEGSQVRTAESLQKVIESHEDRFARLYQKFGVNEEAQVVMAIALNPNGSVESASLVGPERANARLSKAVVAEMTHVQFEAVTGEGYYVFWYPINFSPR